jgi:hypothetical protein
MTLKLAADLKSHYLVKTINFSSLSFSVDKAEWWPLGNLPIQLLIESEAFDKRLPLDNTGGLWGGPLDRDLMLIETEDA